MTDTVQDEAPGTRSTDEYAHLTPLFAALGDGAEGVEARERLVRGYLPVAEHIARRYRGRGLPEDDLAQIATVGLINAIDRFQPDRGVNFLSFAVPTIMGEVRRYFRDHSWSMRMPRRLQELHSAVVKASDELFQELGRAPRPSEIATRLAIPVDDVYDGIEAAAAYRPESVDRPVSEDGDATVADTIGDADAELDNAENAMLLHPALKRLAPREREIVVMRFHRDMTQSEIGQEIGLSQMHVSRLLARSLAHLRHELADDA